MSFHVPNQHRIRYGALASDERNGNNGAFFIPHRGRAAGKSEPPLKVIASDGGLPGQQAWEHVSVSLPHRCPTWAEMCAIKALFWDDEDVVIQYHPARSEYVNNHSFCLHLWRPVGLALPVQTVREVLPPASPTEGADYPSAHRERVGEGWSA